MSTVKAGATTVVDLRKKSQDSNNKSEQTSQAEKKKAA